MGLLEIVAFFVFPAALFLVALVDLLRGGAREKPEEGGPPASGTPGGA